MADARLGTPISVTEAGGPGIYLVAYLTGTVGSGAIKYRMVTPADSSGSGAISAPPPVAPEVNVVAVGVASATRVSGVYLGVGPLGDRVMIGYDNSNATLKRSEYDTTSTENSGLAWSVPTACTSSTNRGILVQQGTRLHCVFGAVGANLQSSEWSGVLWQTAITIPIKASVQLPSLAVSSGTLVLASAEYGTTTSTEATLAASAAAWSAKTTIGPGVDPVIGAVDSTLVVLTSDVKNSAEKLTRTYYSTDGTTWVEGAPFGGHRLDGVIDYNSAWAFTDDATNDVLLDVRSASGTFGDVTGSAYRPLVVDATNKQASFDLTGLGGSATKGFAVWVAATANAPAYRIGLQSDTAGRPSGHWLGEVSAGGVVVSGDFADVTPTASSSLPVNVSFTTAATLPDPVHIVMAPKPDPLGTAAHPTVTANASLLGVDGMAGAHSDIAISTATGSSWTTVPAAYPVFAMQSPSGVPFATQLLTPSTPQQLGKYAVGGESTAFDSATTITGLDVFLSSTGAPVGDLNALVLDATGSEVTHEVFTPVAGWNAIPLTSAVAAGRYLLVLDDSGQTTGGAWSIATSAGGGTYDGVRSYRTSAPDRNGYNLRTDEASDDATSGDELLAFNAGSADKLYLGQTFEFDAVTLSRGSGASTGSLPLQLSYWNGSAWAALPGSSAIGASSNQTFAFTPPTDWVATEVNSIGRYWLRLEATATLSPLRIARATSFSIATDGMLPEHALGSTIIVTDQTRGSSPSWHADQRFATSGILERLPANQLLPVDSSVESMDNGSYSPAFSRVGDDLVLGGSAIEASTSFSHPGKTSIFIHSGLTLTRSLVGASAASTAFLVNKAAFVAEDALAATDVVVTGSALDLEDSLVLKNASAPESFTWQFDSPSGAHLGTDHTTVIDATGDLLASFSGVTALDATEAVVPVTVTTGTSGFTATVAHHTGAYKYPIIIDPSTIPREDGKFQDGSGTLLDGDHQLRERGYIARSSIISGFPCYAGDMAAKVPWAPQDMGVPYRPECTAQAHAVRKLNDLYASRGFFDSGNRFGPTPLVQWEVGAWDYYCPDGSDDPACETSDQSETSEADVVNRTKPWRADITTQQPNCCPIAYGILEVKRWTGSTSIQASVDAQIGRYIDNFDRRGVVVGKDGALQSVNGGNGWAVHYNSGCGNGNDQWYAWVPMADDAEWGGSIPPSSLAGHVYFAPVNETPNDALNRGYSHGADADFQSLCTNYPKVQQPRQAEEIVDQLSSS